jgi:acyl-CoA reductase-like NAD-dependent aldehyde dehydrogenase
VQRSFASETPAEDDYVAYGPLIDEVARDRVHAIVQDTVAAGARLVTGGSYDHLCYRPTVLADVPLEARAYQEEIFGPVAPIVGFKDIDEAARLATETECGLSLAILTTEIMSGLWMRTSPTGVAQTGGGPVWVRTFPTRVAQTGGGPVRMRCANVWAPGLDAYVPHHISTTSP